MKRHLNQIRSLIGKNAVLIPCQFKSKRPQSAWKHIGQQHMQDPDHLDKLAKAGNIAVVLGKPSGGLVSLDFDDEGALKEFCSHNPKISQTLITAASRGANLWLRMLGDYPPLHRLIREGEQVGEFRSDGGYTLIHGVHPEGMNYRVKQSAPVVTVSYSDIEWPPNFICSPTSDVTERTEITEEYGSGVVGMVRCSNERVFDPAFLADDFIPVKPKTNHVKLFEICRRIRGREVECGCRADLQQLINVFEYWYNKSTPFLCKSSSREEYLDEFLDAYERVQHPEIDDILQTAMDRANEQPLPPEANNPLFTTPKAKQLIALCYQMSQLSINGVFFISCRTAQKLLELPNHMRPARWLSLMVKADILKIHQAGDRAKRRATRYTYNAIRDDLEFR